MLIEFTIWGEYDEIVPGPNVDDEKCGLIRVKLNDIIIHEEECFPYTSPNDRESAILEVVKRVFAKRNG